MAPRTLSIFGLGSKGVDVDSDPLHIDPNSLRKAQNAIADSLGHDGGLANRPGLSKFNRSAAAGRIIGGIGVPLKNKFTGSRLWYLGRGPIT